MVWVLTHTPYNVPPASIDTWSGKIEQWIQPILTPIGISAELGITLFFGFIAKEIVIGALAVIYGLQGAALSGHIATHIQPIEAISFMLFTLLYTPCVSTLATLKSESKSLPFMLLSVAWSCVLAWCVSFVFYQAAHRIVF